MEDEKILLDSLNEFEDYMENADVEEIKREHGISSKVVVVDSAETVHNRICSNFKVVERTLYDICTDLKTIRDNKYYKTLGYNTFEDYCLDNFNMARRTAYRYISIAENLTSDFVSSKAQIGVNKLGVLSRLTDIERSELIKNTDVEKTSVKELEQKSKKIKENRKVQDVVEQIKDNRKAIPDDNTFFEPEHLKLSDLDKLFVCLDDLKSHLIFRACGDTTFYNADYLTTPMLKKIKTSILMMQDMIDIFRTILVMEDMDD